MENIDKDTSLTVPRGGPLYVPDLVSPLTRVSIFENDVFFELESLKAEVDEDFQDDILVDELRVYSDEDLVSEAMMIAFEDDHGDGNSADLANQPCSSRDEDGHRTMNLDTSTSNESSNDIASMISLDGALDDANVKKRNQRRKAKTSSKNSKNRKVIAPRKGKEIDETYLTKIEHLAKIRQKQEEDKASVELHSFNHKKDNGAVLSSRNVETLRYLESLHRLVKDKSSLTRQSVPIQYPEVVLCVEVYHNKHNWIKTQELMVLGSQTLTELRDKIRCVTDAIMQKAGADDASGYFLIEEYFCNDTRNPSTVDYSEPILDWLRNCKDEALAKWNCILSGAGRKYKLLTDGRPVSNLPTFRSVAMQQTRFGDLAFRIGAGYLYCHQGDCKHVIVIRDMRLIHPEDVQNRAAYPLLLHQKKHVLKKCSVCQISKATKVTLDDKLGGENPCYFCDNCYYLLHYSADGTLLYDQFLVYDYLEDYN